MTHKKQAQEFINKVYDFNHKAGLADKGYDDFLESSFQIEEALEGFQRLPDLARQLSCSVDSPKELSRAIAGIAYEGLGDEVIGYSLPDVERLDKACDAVVFAVGSMAKLGLNPQQITKALNIVMDANIQKLTMPTDDKGKLMKPANFEGPEPKLQKLLDER